MLFLKVKMVPARDVEVRVFDKQSVLFIIISNTIAFIHVIL